MYVLTLKMFFYFVFWSKCQRPFQTFGSSSMAFRSFVNFFCPSLFRKGCECASIEPKTVHLSSLPDINKTNVRQKTHWHFLLRNSNFQWLSHLTIWRTTIYHRYIYAVYLLKLCVARFDHIKTTKTHVNIWILFWAPKSQKSCYRWPVSLPWFWVFPQSVTAHGNKQHETRRKPSKTEPVGWLYQITWVVIGSTRMHSWLSVRSHITTHGWFRH